MLLTSMILMSEFVSNLLIPLRPLLAFYKLDITTMARKIGTFEIIEDTGVCDAFGPITPTTVVNNEHLTRS